MTNSKIMQIKKSTYELRGPSKSRPKSEVIGQNHKSIAGKSLVQIFSSTALQRDMSRVLYGCYAIEDAGGPLLTTTYMCKLVFKGLKLDVSLCPEQIQCNYDLPSLTNEYERLGLRGKSWHDENALKALHHDVQRYVEAFRYMMQKLIVEERELNEGMLKKCHWIMMKTPNDVRPAGRYRSGNLRKEYGTRPETDTEYDTRILTQRQLRPNRPPSQRITMPKYYSKFVCGTDVSWEMGKFISEYRYNVQTLAEERRTSQSFDNKEYVSLATRTHLRLFSIHPFKAGNNRICSMLLNTILLKYTGKLTAFGTAPVERDRYMSCMWRANDSLRYEAQMCQVPWSTECHHAFQYMVELGMADSQHDVPDSDSDGGVAIAEESPESAIVQKVEEWYAGVSSDDAPEDSHIDRAFLAAYDEGGISCLYGGRDLEWTYI